MRIMIESSQRITMTPETEQERAELDDLWKAIIRCNEDSKILCPIGVYTATEHEKASFVIKDQ